MSLKNIFYDWFGVNQAIQQYLHDLTNHKIFYQTMYIGSNIIGNYLLFPAHFLIISIIVALVIHKKNQNLSRSLIQYHSHVISSVYILLVSLLVGAIFIEISKRYFSFPRPFCIHHLLSQIALAPNCFRGFPSGHTAYITIWVISIWPLLNRTYKTIAVITFIWVCVSRIALDQHFPADILYSVLVSLLITSAVTKYINKISSYFSSLNYHMIKLLTRL